MKKKLSTLLYSLSLLAAIPASLSAQTDDPIIHTPPAGTTYNLYRSTTGYESFFYNAMDHQSDGDWSRMVVTDDGSVYMENPVNSFYTNSWIKGKMAENDTIVFEFPQAIYSEEGMSGTNYGYAFRMQLTEDGKSYEKCTDHQIMKYVWRGDSIKKVGDELLGVGMEGGEWISYGELTSVSHIVDNNTLKPANPEAIQDGMMLYLSGTTARQYPVKTAIEGNDVYIGNLSTNMGGYWIKGEMKDGVATFPACSLLGIDTITRTYVYAMSAEVTPVEDPWSGTYYEPSISNDLIEFEYDANEGTLFFRGNVVINKGCNEMNTSTAYDIYQHPQISEWEDHPGQPLPPIFTNFMPYGPSPYGGYDGGIEFKVSYYDVDGNYLNPTKLYYNMYFDNELYTFTPEEYNYLTEPMIDVPFSFKAYDFEHVDENTRRVYFYKDFKFFGVEAVYIDGDTRIASGVTTYDSNPSCIDGQEAQLKPVESVTFTDLSGRTITKPEQGFCLRTTHYTDGTSKTEKIIVRK